MITEKKGSFEISEQQLNSYLQVARYRQQQIQKQKLTSRNYKKLLTKNDKKRTSKNYKRLIKMIEQIQTETALKILKNNTLACIETKKNQLSATATKNFFSRYKKLLIINK